MKTRLVLPILCVPALLSVAPMAPASAQVKPMHSGHLSHGAPQMRADGAGLHRPNRPTYHHHEGYAGYRPVYREAELPTGVLVD